MSARHDTRDMAFSETPPSRHGQQTTDASNTGNVQRQACAVPVKTYGTLTNICCSRKPTKTDSAKAKQE